MFVTLLLQHLLNIECFHFLLLFNSLFEYYENKIFLIDSLLFKLLKGLFELILLDYLYSNILTENSNLLTGSLRKS